MTGARGLRVPATGLRKLVPLLAFVAAFAFVGSIALFSPNAGTPRFRFQQHHQQRQQQSMPAPQMCMAGPADLDSYPETASLRKILSNWHPDQPTKPPFVYDTLCHFDYRDPAQRAVALQYRTAQLPFVVEHIDNADDAVQRWTFEYLQERMQTKRKVVKSASNFFRYGYLKRKDKGGAKAGESADAGHDEWAKLNAKRKAEDDKLHASAFDEWSYGEFLHQAQLVEKQPQKQRDHWYFFAQSQEDRWIAEDLPMLTNQSSLFIDDTSHYKGIHCRFGMAGVIAEGHFDTGQNMIAMLKGAKRYILMAPSQCNAAYIGINRHSKVTWSDVDEQRFPKFYAGRAVETVLKQGQVILVLELHSPSLSIPQPCSKKHHACSHNTQLTHLIFYCRVSCRYWASWARTSHLLKKET